MLMLLNAHELLGFTCARSLTVNSKFPILQSAKHFAELNFLFSHVEFMQVNPNKSFTEWLDL